MTSPTPPRRRDDPRMQTVEMAAVAADLALEVPGGRRAELSVRRTAVLVFAGGALGAVLRWAIELAVPSTLTSALVEIPWATWTANVLGCLVLGVLTGVIETRDRMPAWTGPLIGTGICGGFTTFSTLVLQVSAMVGADFPLTALQYGLGSVVLAIGALVAGLVAGRGLGRRR